MNINVRGLAAIGSFLIHNIQKGSYEGVPVGAAFELSEALHSLSCQNVEQDVFIKEKIKNRLIAFLLKYPQFKKEICENIELEE